MGRGIARAARVGLACWLFASACGGAARPPETAVVSPSPAAPAAADAGSLMGSSDLDRLAVLARERGRGGADVAYRIGPDDLLDVKIPDLIDAQPFQQGAPSGSGSATAGPAAVASAPAFQNGHRVDDRGAITLPLLGSVRASGRTAAELETEIARRLVAAGILRRPQVSVQIAEYRSRVVAVVGNVERPGTYPLTRPGATVADMIWAAGGPGKEAGRVVFFSPGGGTSDRIAANAAGTATGSDADPIAAAPSAGGSQPIRIDLQALLHAAEAGRTNLNPPVRPGDVISVSGAGSVLIEGWVDKPGSYPVTPGLTLSGAVVAAGGSVYAADLEEVQVRRTLGPGEQRIIPVDLVAVAEGREPDVPILDGDVVTVPMHSGRAVPYGLWKLGREVIHVGASVPIF